MMRTEQVEAFVPLVLLPQRINLFDFTLPKRLHF